MAGPTSTSPVVWLKSDTGVYSDAGSTACTNGDTVYQWNDQSGNGNHAVQTTSGDRPTYNTNKVNGLPSISFNSKHLLQPYVGTTAYILIVVKSTVSGDNCVLSAQPSSGPSSPYWLMTGQSSGYCKHQRTGSVSVEHTGGRCTNVWFAFSGSISGTTVKTYINGVEKYSGTITTPVTPTTTGYIGCGYYSGRVAYFTGELAEVLIYDTVPGSTELAEIQAYIKARYFPTITISNYALATFNGDYETFRLFTGSTNTSFDERLVSYVPSTSSTSCRDPSIIKYSNVWYQCHTTVSFSTGTSFAIASSEDLTIWNEIKTVDCSSISGVDQIWAPEFFVDDDDSVYVIFSAHSGSTRKLYEVHPTTSDLSSTWSTPVEITASSGSFPTETIDGCMNKIGSTYYLTFKNNGTYVLGYATSSSLTSGYTVVKDGTTSYIGSAEGPSIIPITGGYRCYYDWVGADPYGIRYKDSTDDLVSYGSESSITTLDLLGASVKSRHGTIFRTPTVAPPPFPVRVWRRWPKRR